MSMNRTVNLGAEIGDLCHSIGRLELEVKFHASGTTIREVAIDSLLRLNLELGKKLGEYREAVKP